MISRPLNILEISDIHLGHPNTPTTNIIKGLREAIPDTPETGELDIIWIAGDLFDRLLTLPDANVIEIKHWAIWFLAMCQRRDILIGVLEGTPSHDWKQNQLLVTLNNALKIGADLHYVEVLSIVHIEKFDIDVLYVPDEWEPETDDTWVQVKQLLADHQLEKVDFCVMHGAFDYQLPAHVNVPTHDPKRYLDITRHYVFIGHIHKHSKYKRILAAGSFDRLTHGEEEAKGHLRVVVNPAGDDSIRFVENPRAWTYQTIDCTGDPVDEALKKVREFAEHTHDGSFIRVQADQGDDILVSMDILRKEYPQHNFSSKVAKRKGDQQSTIIDLGRRFQPVAISPTNIEKLLLDRLVDEGVGEADLPRVKELLSEHIA